MKLTHDISLAAVLQQATTRDFEIAFDALKERADGHLEEVLEKIAEAKQRVEE